MRIEKYCITEGIFDMNIPDNEEQIIKAVNNMIDQLRKDCKKLGIKELEYGSRIDHDPETGDQHYYAYIDLDPYDSYFYRITYEN